MACQEEEVTLLELQEIVQEIEAEWGLTPRQVFEQIPPQDYVPIAIFADRRFGIMEALVKYLVENRSMSYKQVALLLDRDNRAIWVTYNHARKKTIYKFRDTQGYMIPLSVFAGIKRGVLGALARYCSRTLGLGNAEIARMLGRDARTIWAVLNR
jgi:hypothetical protein